MSAVATTARTRVAVQSNEATLARVAIAALALHVLDDNFLEPNPGVPVSDHVAGGLLLFALLSVAAAVYPGRRAGLRAAIALSGGFLGLLLGSEALYYATEGRMSDDDYSGLLSIAAGIFLLALGSTRLWTSRRRGGSAWWRVGRRLLIAGGALLVVNVLLLPLTVAYVVTHTARAAPPRPQLGAPYENVEFVTSDGLHLKGWYIKSRNGAAIVAVPGRTSAQQRAKLLARHGYGVLVFDRRGEGESDGDPNVFGWDGARDVHAAVAYLRSRRDVDPTRIGGIGLSVGGEVLIQAAAESRALRAIVTEGASGRSVRDDLANPDTRWQETLGDTVATAGTALFTSSLPPTDLQALVPRIDAATFFIYGENGQPSEEPANKAFYHSARGPKQLWEVPGSGHIGGTEARPDEYERRVVAFFDRRLLGLS
jgi:dienelactone hydrolase